MSHYKTIFIVNPAAAKGALGSAWASLALGLKGKIQHFDFGFTRGPKDAIRLTTKALHEGFEMVVAVGGDGTLNECLNGFFEDGKLINEKAVLGILPFGRGSDWARGMGIARDPSEAMVHLKGDSIQKIDVGVVDYLDEVNKPASRYFINIANVGLVPAVCQWSERSPRFIGSKGAYAYGAIKAFKRHQYNEVSYADDKGHEDEVKLLNIVVANGIYFGSGMKIAPQALVDDGLFDILVADKIKLSQFIKNFPKLYSGKISKIDQVHSFRSSSLKVTPKYDDEETWIEVDGDPVGKLPATFKLLKKAVRFKI